MTCKRNEKRSAGWWIQLRSKEEIKTLKGWSIKESYGGSRGKPKHGLLITVDSYQSHRCNLGNLLFHLTLIIYVYHLYRVSASTEELL